MGWGSWIARTVVKLQLIKLVNFYCCNPQIDLGSRYKVTAIATQGMASYFSKAWISGYKVQSSDNGNLYSWATSIQVSGIIAQSLNYWRRLVNSNKWYKRNSNEYVHSIFKEPRHSSCVDRRWFKLLCWLARLKENRYLDALNLDSKHRHYCVLNNHRCVSFATEGKKSFQ